MTGAGAVSGRNFAERLRGRPPRGPLLTAEEAGSSLSMTAPACTPGARLTRAARPRPARQSLDRRGEGAACS